MPPKKKKTEHPVRPRRYNKHLRLSRDTTEPVEDEMCDGDSIEDQADITSDDGKKEKEAQIGEPTAEKTSEDYSKDGVHEKTKGSSIEDLLAEVLYNHNEGREMNEDTYDDGCNSENECFNDDREDTDENTKMESDKPIYFGHSMPIRVSMLLILLYSVTHGVSGSQLNDLLTLIGAHCLEAHPGLRSLFHFKKYFADLKSPFVKHHFCTHCLTCVEKTTKECPNQSCRKDLNDSKSVSYFLEIPIESQLRNFFNRPGFTDHLKHRFRRKPNQNIEDIYDGKIYKKFSVDGGPLSESYPYNISFTLNTDGVPIFKSSKFSIWPMYLMINELPFKQRKQSENMIFCGLWFGDVKPFMGTFSQPLHRSLKKLEEDGISLDIGTEKVTCKCFLICVTADLPARSILLNMNQFNGAHSCAYCTEKGSTFRTDKKGSVHIFPFSVGHKENLRTHEGCISDAKKAVNTNSTVQGIKGPSFLMCLKGYDFVKGTCIDYMHGLLLGITKLMLNLWISPSFSKEDFSIASLSDLVDSRLLEIHPPQFITRVPRAISTHFKYWKASELRSWLMFYSVPVLRGILHENYLLHYAAFVQAVHCLNGSSISLSSLDQAEQLLAYFVMTFPALYGERYQTLNLHSLMHLSDCVRNLGPLWAYSCFPFETANGDITKLFHGTQYVDTQILSSVNIIQMLPELISSVPQHYEILFQKICPKRLTKRVQCFHIQFLGKGFSHILTEQENDQVMALLNFEPPNMIFYNRVILRGELFHSKCYNKVKKRNSFTVKFFCPSTNTFMYGFVRFFGNHLGVTNNKAFTSIQVLKSTGSIFQQLQSTDMNKLGVSLPHIHVCKLTNEFKVVELHNLHSVCVHIKFSNSDLMYVCDTPNKNETD